MMYNSRQLEYFKNKAKQQELPEECESIRSGRAS